jgi:hypothetical protein
MLKVDIGYLRSLRCWLRFRRVYVRFRRMAWALGSGTVSPFSQCYVVFGLALSLVSRLIGSASTGPSAMQLTRCKV